MVDFPVTLHLVLSIRSVHNWVVEKMRVDQKEGKMVLHRWWRGRINKQSSFLLMLGAHKKGSKCYTTFRRYKNVFINTNDLYML